MKAKKKDIQEDDAESLEHIIPNALGGKLASKKILSHRANQDLNDLIDKDFVRIFDNFCLLLDVQKDRKTSPSLRATHKGYNVDVVLKNDKYFPKKPIFDHEKKAIYASSQKTGERYREHLLKAGAISDTDDIRVFDDMAGGIELSFSLDSYVFKMGLAKIAAGFASLHKVSRDNLKNVINSSTNTFQERIIVAPSIPKSEIEYEFEKKAQGSHHYPIHGLVLSGSKKDRILYCHVELFSAFQWYVILDYDYCGNDIRHVYAHRLSDGVDIDFEQYFSSVLTQDQSSTLLKTYKVVSREYLAESLRAHRDQKLKAYTYFKFNSLAAFANYAFLSRKAESLGLRWPPEEVED